MLILSFSFLACASSSGLALKQTSEEKTTEKMLKENGSGNTSPDSDEEKYESEESLNEDETQKNDALDCAKLFGAWKLVSSDVDMSLGFNYIVFTHDGYATLRYFVSSKEISEADSWWRVEDNSLLLLNPEDGVEENVTFEIISNDNNDTKQTLRLFIDEKEKIGPTKTSHFKATLTFERDISESGEVYIYTLPGKWKDNYENTWKFEVLEDDSTYSVHFVIVDSGGIRYKSRDISPVWIGLANDKKTIEIEFALEKSSSSIDGKILSYDGYTMDIIQDDGSSLTLTRTE